jgi:hypothetical protein
MHKKFLAIAIACMMSVTVQVNGMLPSHAMLRPSEYEDEIPEFDLNAALEALSLDDNNQSNDDNDYRNNNNDNNNNSNKRGRSDDEDGALLQGDNKKIKLD